MKEQKDTKLYEIGYIAMPLLAPETLVTEVDELKAGLVSLGAEIKEEGFPRITALGYPMPRRIGEKKYNFQDGFFGWVRFELMPDKALAAKERLDKRTNLLRYLLIAVDEAAVLADIKAIEAKKAAREAATDKPVDAVDGEMDKELDAVLAPQA